MLSMHCLPRTDHCACMPIACYTSLAHAQLHDCTLVRAHTVCVCVARACSFAQTLVLGVLCVQGQEGMYSQQDAEECWTNLMYAVREKAKASGSGLLGFLPTHG